MMYLYDHEDPMESKNKYIVLPVGLMSTTAMAGIAGRYMDKYPWFAKGYYNALGRNELNYNSETTVIEPGFSALPDDPHKWIYLWPVRYAYNGSLMLSSMVRTFDNIISRLNNMLGHTADPWVVNKRVTFISPDGGDDVINTENYKEDLMLNSFIPKLTELNPAVPYDIYMPEAVEKYNRIISKDILTAEEVAELEEMENPMVNPHAYGI